MAHVRIYIETDNAAFDDHAGEELARILDELEDKAARYASLLALDGMTVRDSNGNTIGRVDVVES